METFNSVQASCNRGSLKDFQREGSALFPWVFKSIVSEDPKNILLIDSGYQIFFIEGQQQGYICNRITGARLNQLYFTYVLISFDGY